MSLTKNLEQLSLVRHGIVNCLEEMTAILTEAEIQGENTSGKLSLGGEIEQLQTVSNNLRQNKFRLLVLGDMKRGKSTFINALLGEKLSPSDVNPCTALLTVLRYGKKKQVTIYFKDGSQSKTIDLVTFKQEYTIDYSEAKLLAQRQQLAFPNVDRAVIEYPLPLLKGGLEIIDSPGLNDTEARNELTLKYIYQCHGILFIFRAIQPCTLAERRYLKNYLQGDITTFFIINAWDEIEKGLVDPEDTEELNLAQTKIRQVFHANLAPYLTPETYTQRVFELSSLNALRQKNGDREADLTNTGMTQFVDALNSFLHQEKAIAEFKQGQRIATQIVNKVNQAVDRRIPLLDETISNLNQKIVAIEPEFQQLADIRDRFQQEIKQAKNKQTQKIADSFAEYILNLEQTFEADFLASQPDLNFADFLDKNKRDEFQTAFKQAFERYMNDRLASWEFSAKQKLSASFDRLNGLGQKHQLDYDQVIAEIDRKLLGSRFTVDKYSSNSNRVSPWADNISDIFFGVPDNINGTIDSFNTFWQTVLASICITIGLRIVGLLFTSVALNIFGAILLGFGTIALQAEYVRRQFLDLTKKEFIKYLPQIVESQKPLVINAIERCFDTYEKQAIDKINLDLESRQSELANLVEQKQNRQINRDVEIERLHRLKNNITAQLREINKYLTIKNRSPI